jgi:hypothetical protein
MNAKISFLAVSAGLILSGTAVQTASAQGVIYGTRNRPLEGRRYETMRALAHYLDQTAQSALQTAQSDARRGASERRVLPLIRDFARRADAFHGVMDNYETSRRDVPPQVSDLILRARRVNERMGGTYLAASTRQDWSNVIDVLDRMKRLMAGQDVQVPDAHAGFKDYDRDYGMFGGVRRTGDEGGSLSGWAGTRLADFRNLARDLDESALRAHQIAETNRANYTNRQQDFLSDLRRFAERAHAVRLQADAREVNRREIAPIVNQLLQDARATDRSLRDTRVFPQVWDQWTRTIDVLNRMSDLARD